LSADFANGRAVRNDDRADQMTEASEADALSGLAPLLRVRPELQDVCRFGGGWTAPHAAERGGWAYFHLVTRGRCLLERPGAGPLALETGDVLLLPRGDAHILRAGETGGRLAPAVAVGYSDAIRIKTSVGVEPDTELICGRLHFDAVPETLVIAALPEVIVLPSGRRDRLDRFALLMAAIRDELDGGRPGAAAIAVDLASALLVMMLRDHLEAAPPPHGLLALLAHRPTALAVQAMLKEPARNWSLDELAAFAAASRATLVRAFRKAAGIAPLAFLTEIRLGLARQKLRMGEGSIGQIADEVGYQSEAALSRAIVRRFGVRPGSLRGSAPAQRQAALAPHDPAGAEPPQPLGAGEKGDLG
jgi:AraC family transcriptional activator of mtrCDE